MHYSHTTLLLLKDLTTKVYTLEIEVSQARARRSLSSSSASS